MLPLAVSAMTIILGWWRFRRTARKDVVQGNRTQIDDLQREVANLQRRQDRCEESLKRCEEARLSLTEEKLLLMELVLKGKLPPREDR